MLNPPASLVLLRLPKMQKRTRAASFLLHICARLFQIPADGTKEVSIRHKLICRS
jgi:hypothetical protein